MFKNYFKLAMRNIIRQKGFSFINIAGLAIGMACCLIILLFGIILNKFILKKNYPLVSNFMNSKYKILNYKPTTNKELK